MIIDLVRYNSLSGDFFDSIVYTDRLTVNYLPPDGLPIFNEELLSEDNSQVFKTGDFDLKMSLLQTETTDEGNTVEGFFADIESTTIFFCNVRFNEDLDAKDTWRAGMIDINSIRRLKTYNKNDHYIQFTVFGLLKEVEKYFSKEVYDTEAGGNISFDSYMDLMFRRISGFPTIRILNRLNIATKVGFMPIVHGDFHDEGVLEEFHFEYSDSINRWQVLSDIAKQFGFLIRPQVQSIGSDGRVEIELVLYFRDSGVETMNPGITSHEEGYSLSSIDYKYIFIKLARYNQFGDEEETSGMFITKGNDWMVLDVAPSMTGRDYFEIDLASGVVRIVGDVPAGFEEETDMNEVYFLNFNTFNNTRFNLNDAFPDRYIFSRIFCKEVTGNGLYSWGYNEIADALIRPELMRMFRGFKRVKYMGIVFELDENVAVGNTMTIDGTDYVCERVRNIDLINRTADIELMEA